jgi:hypothetical protein
VKIYYVLPADVAQKVNQGILPIALLILRQNMKPNIAMQSIPVAEITENWRKIGDDMASKSQIIIMLVLTLVSSMALGYQLRIMCEEVENIVQKQDDNCSDEFEK